MSGPTRAATRTRTRARHRRSRLASAGLHATLLFAVCCALFPVAWVAYTSLRPGGEWAHPARFDPGGLNLANYRHILADTQFLRWFGNSVVVAGGTMLVGVLISASSAYALSRMRFPGHRSLMWAFLVTQMFPMAILIVPLYTIMNALHLLNTYGSLILAYCTVAVPFSAWLLKGYFDTIPVELDEAGQVDGLSPFGTFWRLVVPLAKPGLAVAAFYTFITAWGEVAYATQFMTGERQYTLAVGLQTFVGQFKAQWGLLTAAAVLITVPAGVVFFLVQRHLVSGLTAGGTKG